jgi:hypothetical protein
MFLSFLDPEGSDLISVGWIRLRNGMRIRVQKGKNDLQKYKKWDKFGRPFLEA